MHALYWNAASLHTHACAVLAAWNAVALLPPAAAHMPSSTAMPAARPRPLHVQTHLSRLPRNDRRFDGGWWQSVRGAAGERSAAAEWRGGGGGGGTASGCCHRGEARPIACSLAIARGDGGGRMPPAARQAMRGPVASPTRARGDRGRGATRGRDAATGRRCEWLRAAHRSGLRSRWRAAAPRTTPGTLVCPAAEA
eukprot:2088764-Prymnesium_polylepis.1